MSWLFPAFNTLRGYRLPAVLTALLLLGGCATVGHDFPASEVTQIHLGQTTQAQIRQMFGNPWRVGVENGKRTWTYGLYHYSAFGQPSTKDLVVRFNDHNIVEYYSFNTTAHTADGRPQE